MISLDLMIIMLALMPGIVGVTAARFFTVARKPDQFDLIVYSLVLTVVIYFIFYSVQTILSNFFSIELLPKFSINDTAPFFKYSEIFTQKNLWQYVFLNLFGLVIGVIISRTVNNGKLFKLFQWLHLTRKTGNLDIWQDYFQTCTTENWVVVTVDNGKRYSGFVKFYSNDPNNRDIVLGEPKFLEQNSEGNIIELALSDQFLYIMSDKIVDICSFDKFYKPIIIREGE